MSGFKRLELDFLWEISKTLTKISSEKGSEKGLLEELKSVFEKYLNVNNVQIFIYDEPSRALRDFEKPWINIEKNARNEEVLNLFKGLKAKPKNSEKAEKNFSLNGNSLSYEMPFNHLEEAFIQGLCPENNILCFPIINGKKTIGLLELCFDDIINEVKKSDFLAAMGIAAAQISSAVTNRILNNQMVISLNFQSVMKNIAKLIETQYDLTYILPIIGEMVDKFVNDHLIYIFMKDKNIKGNFVLVWPLNCTDEKITSLLNSFEEQKNNTASYLLSSDSKTGIWAIKKGEELIGAIAAGSGTEKLSAKEVEYLAHLARQASVTIEHASSYAQILQYATLDALTGLNNRRQFEIRLNQEVATAKRKHKPLCCIMLDIDHFKSVNDTYGHAAGDSVLKSVAKIIAGELREYDIASRYGGEEFCILLPFTVIKEAEFVAERLRSAVEKAQILICDEDILKVTISVGVSSFAEDFEEPKVLYENADAALYEAKKGGRNRVVVYKD